MKRVVIGMKRFSLKKVAALIALSTCGGAVQAQALPLCVSGTAYSTVGDNSCTVPPGVTSMNLVVEGGYGGDPASAYGASGGSGAMLTVTNYAVTPRSTLPIFVGGAGTSAVTDPGGGGGGGGSSQVNAGAPNQIIAGGGGGGGVFGIGGKAGDIFNGNGSTAIPLIGPAISGGGGGRSRGIGSNAGGGGSGGAGGNSSPTIIGGTGSGSGAGGNGGDNSSGGGGGGYGGGGGGSTSAGGGGGSIGPVGSTTYQTRVLLIGGSGVLSGSVLLTFVAGAVGVPDTANATAGTASTPIANVLANDTVVDAVPATTSNATLTVVTPTSDAGVVLDAATGAVTTTAAVPPGTYTITYQLCDKATPTSCATSTATVTVAGAANPQSDTGNATAGAASTPIANVLANDTVDGVPATTSNATLTVVTPASHAGVVLDTATGSVTTTAAVPSGTYTITYQLCDKATPAVCATSTATVIVTASTPTNREATPVPTLKEYGLIFLSFLLATLATPNIRRRMK